MGRAYDVSWKLDTSITNLDATRPSSLHHQLQRRETLANLLTQSRNVKSSIYRLRQVLNTVDVGDQKLRNLGDALECEVFEAMDAMNSVPL